MPFTPPRVSSHLIFRRKYRADSQLAHQRHPNRHIAFPARRGEIEFSPGALCAANKNENLHLAREKCQHILPQRISIPPFLIIARPENLFLLSRDRNRDEMTCGHKLCAPLASSAALAYFNYCARSARAVLAACVYPPAPFPLF